MHDCTLTLLPHLAEGEKSLHYISLYSQSEDCWIPSKFPLFVSAGGTASLCTQNCCIPDGGITDQTVTQGVRTVTGEGLNFLGWCHIVVLQMGITKTQ